ncbi:response regulator [Sporolactobacillus vineae]|uniref:response regulator n=1 Tax=Sporolactobacillus vineae TaxID=444463 RepID=UPI0002896646|nr:response regulator [Sporolactobacillus vineae]
MIKVLIVDDSKFSQKITASLIGKQLDGVAFEFADDGEEGLEKFKSDHPDYIVTDLLMPKLRGQDLIERIKQVDIDAKVIVLSADVQSKVREVVRQMHVLAFINKPMNEAKAKEIAAIIGNGAA